MNKLSARKIPNPKLELGKNKFVEQGKESNFQLFGQPVFSGKHPLRVAIIHSKNADLTPMIKTFESTAKNLNVEF